MMYGPDRFLKEDHSAFTFTLVVIYRNWIIATAACSPAAETRWIQMQEKVENDKNVGERNSLKKRPKMVRAF